jgi:hypothetical protein
VVFRTECLSQEGVPIRKVVHNIQGYSLFDIVSDKPRDLIPDDSPRM